MTETALEADDIEPAPDPKTEPQKESWLSLAWFVIKLLAFFFLVRSLIISPFMIPSESMLPRLMIGDFLFVTKYNYGYSKYSFEFPISALKGTEAADGPPPDPATASAPVTRYFAGTPERGDVVVFKAPPYQEMDYIKRVIGLPGDKVEMINGTLYLNGAMVPKVRINDMVTPVTENMIESAATSPHHVCMSPSFMFNDKSGQSMCRWPRYRETLPNGKSYDVLDIDPNSKGDNYGPEIVPPGHLFLMGDNRDGSADSRFPAERNKAIGFVPVQNLVGKAQVTFFSTDGSAVWYKPWTWVTAARGSRIGEGF